MHYSIGYRRFTLLETSTAKVCKAFFYLTDLFAEDVAKREAQYIALRSLMISEFEMELLESYLKLIRAYCIIYPFSKIN
jgi:hypothetical protein